MNTYQNEQKLPFTQISNALVRDTTLSLRAKGLLALLLSYSGTWQLNNQWTIHNHVKEGEAAYYSALKELRNAGYVVYTQVKDERGRITGHHYRYSDIRLAEPLLEKPHVAKCGNKNNNIEKTNNYDEKDGGEERSDESPSSLTLKKKELKNRPKVAKYGLDIEEWYRKCEEASLEPKWNRERTSIKSLCPVHKEDSPSFNVSKGKSVDIVCHCFGCGCGIEEATQYLFPVAKNDAETFSHFVYTDEAGNPLYKVCRSKDKTQFWVEVPKDGKWARAEMSAVSRVPYRLHKLAPAIRRGETVYVVEGEKDVETAEKRGLVATCNPFGSNSWRGYFADHFKGARVVVIRDKDDAGSKWADAVMSNLRGVAHSLLVYETPVDKVGADLTDHFEAGLGIGDLSRLGVAA